MQTEITFNPIGIVHSCFKEKFGIPRQPGLIESAKGTIELLAPYNDKDAVRGLESFSHIWVLFQFHGIKPKPWKPTVRPPRLGGNQRLGVFATRSTFRPNNIGMSAVRLERVQAEDSKVILHVSGIDLLDGTPVLDIKPYIAYSDNINDSQASYANEAPKKSISVVFANETKHILASLSQEERKELETLITQTIQLDPRPAYYRNSNSDTGTEFEEFGVKLLNWNVRWRQNNEHAEVFDISLIREN